MKGLEEETEENVGGEQDESEDDGAAHTSPCAHAVGSLFLFGFLFSCRFFGGSGVAAITGESRVAVGSGGLFHACFVGRGCHLLPLGRCFGIKADAFLSLGCWRIGPVGAWCDACLGHGLPCLQQALRADDHAIIGNQLLVADFQLFPAFRTSPAHCLGFRY